MTTPVIWPDHGVQLARIDRVTGGREMDVVGLEDSLLDRAFMLVEGRVLKRVRRLEAVFALPAHSVAWKWRGSSGSKPPIARSHCEPVAVSAESLYLDRLTPMAPAPGLIEIPDADSIETGLAKRSVRDEGLTGRQRGRSF